MSGLMCAASVHFLHMLVGWLERGVLRSDASFFLIGALGLVLVVLLGLREAFAAPVLAGAAPCPRTAPQQGRVAVVPAVGAAPPPLRGVSAACGQLGAGAGLVAVGLGVRKAGRQTRAELAARGAGIALDGGPQELQARAARLDSSGYALQLLGGLALAVGSAWLGWAVSRHVRLLRRVGR